MKRNAAILARKGQLHILESMVALLAFSMLLAVAIAFYGAFQRTAYATELGQTAEARAVALSKAAVSLPELQCSSRNIVRNENCIDLLKLQEMEKQARKDPDSYYELLGYSTIEIEQVYPAAPGAKIMMRAYDKKPPEHANELRFQVPVTLYDPVQRTYAFGVLSVVSYS